MGCGASTPRPNENVTLWKQNDPSYQQRMQKRRTGSIARMSEATHDAVRTMFSEYREYRRSSVVEEEEDESEVEGGVGEGAARDRAKL